MLSIEVVQTVLQLKRENELFYKYCFAQTPSKLFCKIAELSGTLVCQSASVGSAESNILEG